MPRLQEEKKVGLTVCESNSILVFIGVYYNSPAPRLSTTSTPSIM